MFFLPCALTAVIIYAVKKKINLKALLPFLLSGIPGVLAGTAISGIVGAKIVAKLFGAGLIFMGIREIFTKPKTQKNKQKLKNCGCKSFGDIFLIARKNTF